MIKKLQSLAVMLGALMLLARMPALADRTPDWMVGQFESDARSNGRTITLRVTSQGGLTALTGRGGVGIQTVGASYRGDILTLDDRDYTVVKTNDGFRAVPDRNRTNQGNVRNRDDNDRFAQIFFHRVDNNIDNRRGNDGRTGNIAGDRAPDWLVGRFEGTGARDIPTMNVMVDRDGNVTASSRNGRRMTAYTTSAYRRGTIVIDNQEYRVTQSRTGFLATPVNDRNTRRNDRSPEIDFRRVGDFIDDRTSARDTGRLPDWLNGTFEGYSRKEGQTLTFHASRQGSLSANIKGSRRESDKLSVSYRRDTLTIDGTDYTVERTSDGFRAIPVVNGNSPRNDRNGRDSQINFRRIGD